MANRNSQKRRQKKDSPIPHFTVSSDKQVSVTITSSEEIDQIFFGKGSDKLTDELLEELVAKGWERKGLVEFQKEGYRYNRSRNSLVEGETHFEGF